MRRICLTIASVAVAFGCDSSSTDTSAKQPTARADDPITKMMEQSDKPNTTKPIDEETARQVVPPPPLAAVAPTTTDPASIEIKEVDFAAFDQDIAALKGKVVVVDCWATWCTVCKQKFPTFLALTKKYDGRDDVVFASVANDEAKMIDDARAFLADSGAKTKNFLLVEDPNDFAKKFDTNGVPLYLIYGTDGQIVFRSNKIDELSAKLEEILPAKS